MRRALDIRQVRIRHAVQAQIPSHALFQQVHPASVCMYVKASMKEGKRRRTSLLRIESPPESMNCVFLGSSALGISSKNSVFADHYQIQQPVSERVRIFGTEKYDGRRTHIKVPLDVIRDT